jgi:N4-gp56 family major capsid protein
MAIISTGTISNTYQRYFSDVMLEHQKHTLVLAKFGKTAELPLHEGARSMSWVRPPLADPNNVHVQSEGVPPTVFGSFAYDRVDADLVQYYNVRRISDVVKWTSKYNVIKDVTTTMNEEVTLHHDTVVRNALLHQTEGLSRRYAQNLASFDALVGVSAANGALVPFDLLDSTVQLKNTFTPTINGGYVVVLSTTGGREIMANLTVWTPAKQYSDVKDLYNGELGSLYGVRCVEGTNPFREANTTGTEGQFTSSGPIFSSIVLGRECFGVPALSGKSPKSAKVNIIDTADHSNPTNAYITIASSSFWAAAVLNSVWGVVIKHKTQYVGL